LFPGRFDLSINNALPRLDDCPYVSAKQIYRRRQRKAERQRQRSTIVMAVSEFL
ncbi:hypothetical protein JJP91_24555, partial [Enterobacter hormaechei]|nr:hypothetical protein [Enterobacter hormaechei]